MRTDDGRDIGAVDVELILLGPDVPGDLNPPDWGVLLGRPFKGAVMHNKYITKVLFLEYH